MAEYIVIRPWFGVKKGQRVTIEKLNPAFAANVQPVGYETEGANEEQDLSSQHFVDPLALATDQGLGVVDTGTAFDWESVRHDLTAELDDAGITYKDDASAEELAMLLDEEVREGIKMSAE